MKRAARILSSVLALCTLPALASAQMVHRADSPKASLHVTTAIAVGTATLQPGEYNFQCKRIGEQEFLVVTSDADGREVARVPCRPEDLQKKVETSDFRTVVGPGGVPSLTAVRIRGESVAHRVIVD